MLKALTSDTQNASEEAFDLQGLEKYFNATTGQSEGSKFQADIQAFMAMTEDSQPVVSNNRLHPADVLLDTSD